jgi:hypothetical protein
MELSMRLVIHGYLSGLSRPEQVVHFFRQVTALQRAAAGHAETTCTPYAPA